MSGNTDSEITRRAKFDRIRYAQCWEDARILLPALNLSPGGTVLSIASAGDNALALLTADPAKVLAVDLNPAQLECARLKQAAVNQWEERDLLVFHGSLEAPDGVSPTELYQRLRKSLPLPTRTFWDSRSDSLAGGLGATGKFEGYFRLFRRRILPLAHSRRRVTALLTPRSPSDRQAFYAKTWDTWRWRTLFHLFFSRFFMGRMGRDPAFFQYVEGSVAERILQRTRYALTELDPSQNPYLRWILTGRHGDCRPLWLDPAALPLIRQRSDRVEWILNSVEGVLESVPDHSLDGFNLSDIFEYMSPAASAELLTRIARKGKPGARLVYWNMLAPRQRPPELAHCLRPLKEEARELFSRDQAFFYSALRIEEVIA